MLVVLEKIVTLLLLGVLIFNRIQGRHLDGGEKKRNASLLLGGVLLFLLTGLFALRRNALGLAAIGPSFLFPLVAASLLLFLSLGRRILIFRRRCSSCGLTLDWRTTFYRDDNLCDLCRGTASPRREGGQTFISESVDSINWAIWKAREQAVICYIVDKERGRILLIHKKTGLGSGKVNAPGGRIEPGETPHDAAVRECVEEVCLTPENLEKRMELYFQFTDGYSLRGEAFFCTSWRGEPCETEEAKPFWCPLDEIPYGQMWEDDIHWLPRALKGEKLKGYYVFDGDNMLSQRLEPLLEEPQK